MNRAELEDYLIENIEGFADALIRIPEVVELIERDIEATARLLRKIEKEAE